MNKIKKIFLNLLNPNWYKNIAFVQKAHRGLDFVDPIFYGAYLTTYSAHFLTGGCQINWHVQLSLAYSK